MDFNDDFINLHLFSSSSSVILIDNILKLDNIQFINHIKECFINYYYLSHFENIYDMINAIMSEDIRTIQNLEAMIDISYGVRTHSNYICRIRVINLFSGDLVTFLRMNQNSLLVYTYYNEIVISKNNFKNI